MKHICFLILLISTIITTGCRQAKNTGFDSKSDTQITENEISKEPKVVILEIAIPLTGKPGSKEDESLIINLELLGKIWGFLKYHHPEVGKGKYDWDNELFLFLPEYLNVNNPEQRDEALLCWIEKYGEVSECTTCKETAANAYLKPDFSWLEQGNMSLVLKEKIKEIYRNRHQGEHYYIRLVQGVGNPEFSNEKLYSSPYLDTNIRLLALYRYWNMIQYFFPYKYLTDKNWNEVLKEYIPKFILAKTTLEYQQTVLQLLCEINDTHASLVGANKIDSLRWTMSAPFRVRFVEDKLVVADYYNQELKNSAGLEIGHFITHINGKKIEYIIDSLKSYYPASNEAARRTRIANDLVRSHKNSINITYNSSGTIEQKELALYKRSDLNMRKIRSKLSYDKIVIDKDSTFIGYITLETIKETEIFKIKKSFMNAKGIIIDIRNYPAVFVPFLLGNYFTPKRKPFVKFTFVNADNPGEFNFSGVLSLNNSGNSYHYLNTLKTSETEHFQGKLVVIVNEETISQAEYTAMAFRAGDNTVVIGSQTQGADGNVSEIILPGGLQTWFSGIGVYYRFTRLRNRYP